MTVKARWLWPPAGAGVWLLAGLLGVAGGRPVGRVAGALAALAGAVAAVGRRRGVREGRGGQGQEQGGDKGDAVLRRRGPSSTWHGGRLL
jgi:hypothetical protein